LLLFQLSCNFDLILYSPLFEMQLLSRRWRPRWNDTVLRHSLDFNTISPTSSAAFSLPLIYSTWKRIAFGRQPVDNADYMAMLEEVYRQAKSAAPLLYAKAVALSLKSWSSGTQILPVMRFEEMKGADETKSCGKPSVCEHGIAVLCVKPWGRAVEKLVRCYGGDPARLIDCCR
jgi:hypothetical protein